MSLKSIGTLSDAIKLMSSSAVETEESLGSVTSALIRLSDEQVVAAAKAMGLSAAHTATSMHAKEMAASEIAAELASRGFSKSVAEAALIQAGFTPEVAASTVAQYSFAAAEGTATAATVGFSTALKGLGAIIKAHPILAALSAAAVLIPLIVKAVDAFTVSAEEAREAADELHSAFEETSRELESLNSELETSKDRLAELIKLSEAGTITIVEQEELDNLREEIALLEQRERFLKAQKEQDAKESNEALETAFNKQSFTSDLYTYAGEGLRKEREELEKNRKSWAEEDKARYDEITKRLSNLGEAAYRGGFDTISGMRTGQSMEYADYLQLLIDRYNELNSIDLSEKTQADIYEMDALKTRLEQLGASLSEDIQQYEGDGAFKNLLQEYLDSIDAAINKSEVFEREIEKLPEKCVKSLSELGSSGMLNSDMVDALTKDFPELDAAMKTAGLTAEQVAAHFNALSVVQKEGAESSGEYTAQLASLSDIISDTKSSYEALKAAQDDMASGGGLSADTIEKLAKVNGNYLDYLYEENGIIKLNTEAWKENADAKMKGEMAEIQKEIDSLEKQNAALLENISYYQEQVKTYSSRSKWGPLLAEENAKLAENDKAIKDNQDLLAKYEAIYKGMQTASEETSRSLSEHLTYITEQYKLLKDAQKEFAEHDTLSASTLSSIASKFPEMAQSVDLYISGLKTSQELLDDLANAYGADLANYRSSIVGKLMANTEFYNSLGDDQKKMVDDLCEAYGTDLENFKNVEQAKLKFQAEIIRNLSKNYKQYRLADRDELNNRLMYLINNGGDPKEMQALSDAIKAIDTYNKALDEIITEIPDPASWDPERFDTTGLSSQDKKIEEYIADIDKYREAVERLRKAQENVGDLETEIDNAGSLEKRLELQKELIAAYQEEQEALHNLNDQRDATIIKEAQSMRDLGFDVQYDADTNELWISNLEHLNELTAKSKGEYDSVREATNALRKDTEELINTLESLNEANRENSKSWTELVSSIQEANIAIYENTVKERENLITLTENWLEMATGDNDIKRIEQYSDDIVSYYRDMQDTLHQEAEYYRSLGYSDTSDEVSALSDLWWDYENNIKDVKQNVVNYLADIVSSASGMVDEIQNVFDVLKGAADEYAQNGGFISIDTFQKIIDLGPQYMQYLQDENGLLVINEERIQAVTAARAEQLALESAMTYVERLKLALQDDSIEDLNELLYATEQTTGATWDLVKANLAMLGLDDNEYEAALHNIEALKAIAVGAIDGIGKTAGAAESSFDSIMNYVMDMLKKQTQDEIDALNDMKTAYGEIIDQRKAALDAAKKEADYEKGKASKLKDIAKIQAKIDALSLDSSREAQAERIKLEEEKAQLQDSLADAQSDYAIEKQKNALDEMKDAYDEEKDDEIKKLEDSISSQQKLYEKAADYITFYWKNSWDDLRTQLLQWNYDVGNSLQTEIETAWDHCTAYITNHPLGVSGLFQTDSTSNSSSGSGGNKSGNNNAVALTNEGKINAMVTQMKANSAEWNTADANRRIELEAANRDYAAEIGKLLGGKLTLGEDGWWYLPNGKKLYEVYKGTYHTGGFAGEIGSLKDNEIMAKLEKGEPVLTAKMWDSVTAMVERFSKMSKSFADMQLPALQSILPRLELPNRSAINNVTNNNSSPVEINFGSTIINGANSDTVEKHRAITRQQTNELLGKLNVRR